MTTPLDAVKGAFDVARMLMEIGLGVMTAHKEGRISDEQLQAYRALGRTHADAAVEAGLADGIAVLRRDDG
jgi:hypothetical protein